MSYICKYILLFVDLQALSTFIFCKMQIILIQLFLIVIAAYILRNFVRKGKAQQLRILQKILKIVVSFAMLAFTLHVALLLMNINEKYTLHLFGFCGAGAFMLIAASFVLELCWVFVASSIYCYLVNECIILQLDGFFNSCLLQARIIVLTIGIFLTINLIRKILNKCF